MIKKSTLSLMCIAISIGCLFLFGCSASKPGVEQPADSQKDISVPSHKKITQKEAYDIINGKEKFVLLDVRTKEEYDGGHIEGAILIPDYELQSAAPKLLPRKDAKILIYCRSGNRSSSSAKMLADAGYTAVYDFGGITTWPYGIVTSK